MLGGIWFNKFRLAEARNIIYYNFWKTRYLSWGRIKEASSSEDEDNLQFLRIHVFYPVENGKYLEKGCITKRGKHNMERIDSIQKTNDWRVFEKTKKNALKCGTRWQKFQKSRELSTCMMPGLSRFWLASQLSIAPQH